MARILLIWEYGGGLGHVRGLRPIADGLSENNHDVIWAARDVGSTVTALGGRNQKVIQAPILGPRGSDREAVTFCEVMLTLGFGDQVELDALLRAWQSTFELVQPDLVIADFSPTALLAARIAGLPSLTLGNGYTLPPLVSPLPSIQPWLQVPQRRLERAEALVVKAANNALVRHGAPPIAMAAEVFRPQASMQCTLAPLDHYGQQPGETYFGPLVDRLAPAVTAEDILQRDRVFAYLHWQHPKTEAMLRQLGNNHVIGLGFVLGAPEGALQALSSGGLELTDQPQDLAVQLAHTRLLISHGGMGTTTQALLAGIPVLMLPSHMEQALFAHRVEAARLGVIVSRRTKPVMYGTLLKQAMEPDVAQRSAAFAAAHTDFDPDVLYARIVARAESLLAGA